MKRRGTLQRLRNDIVAGTTERQPSSRGGVGFSGLLGLLFIGLKLGGVIQWPWLWVLSPLWIPLAILAAVLTVAGVAMVVAAACR